MHRAPAHQSPRTWSAYRGAFDDVDGVASASLDLATKRTTIVFEPARIGEDQLVQVLTDAGYAPESV